MTAQVLQGAPVAAKLREKLTPEIQSFRKEHGIAPTLAVVRVGDPPAAISYSHSIDLAFTECEMGFQMEALPEQATTQELVSRLEGLARSDDVHGILLQRPLPRTLDMRAVMAAFPVFKDVEGATPYHLGNMAQDTGDYLLASTPSAAIEILKHYGIPIEGKRAVVVGRSNILGKPMAFLLLRENATVAICHTKTSDLAAVTREAELLVAAAGRAKLITADMVSPGTVVIDFGVNSVEGRLVGDVDFDVVKEIAGAITPVPGGTGPVTTVMLMRNTLLAAQRQIKQSGNKGRIRWLPILKPPRPRAPKPSQR